MPQARAVVSRSTPVRRAPGRVTLSVPTRALRGGYAAVAPDPCRFALSMSGGLMDPIPTVTPVP